MADIASGTVETTVAPWAAPVVGGLVGAAVDTAGRGYDVYGQPKVAATSDLQNQAFSGIQSLAMPTAATTAETNLGDVYNKAMTQPAYTGTTFSNQFSAPQAYTAGTFNAGTVSTGIGAPGSIESYMNPYLQNVVDIQAREARRQAEIQRAADARKFQGAFGGGRQALYEAEGVRNLNQKIGDIQAKGLQDAYASALKQRLDEADQYRLAQEATAQLDFNAQKETEASRQFGATRAERSAELTAKYGLEGLKAEEESRQFGADLGLKYLSEAGQSAANLANLGVNQATFDLNRLKSMTDMGATQRAIEQEGLTSDYKDFLEQRDWDKTQQTYLKNILSNLPMTAENRYVEAPSQVNQVLGGAVTASEIYDKLFSKPK